jgi:hypothetical protein
MAVKHYVTSGIGFEPAAYFLTLGLGFDGVVPPQPPSGGGAAPRHRTIIYRRRRFKVDEETLEEFEARLAARLSESTEGAALPVPQPPPVLPGLSAAFRAPVWQPIALPDLPIPLDVVEGIAKSIETELRQRQARARAVAVVLLLTS